MVQDVSLSSFNIERFSSYYVIYCRDLDEIKFSYLALDFLPNLPLRAEPHNKPCRYNETLPLFSGEFGSIFPWLSSDHTGPASTRKTAELLPPSLNSPAAPWDEYVLNIRSAHFSGRIAIWDAWSWRSLPGEESKTRSPKNLFWIFQAHSHRTIFPFDSSDTGTGGHAFVKCGKCWKQNSRGLAVIFK